MIKWLLHKCLCEWLTSHGHDIGGGWHGEGPVYVNPSRETIQALMQSPTKIKCPLCRLKNWLWRRGI